MSARVRVYVADDHPLYLDALLQVLRTRAEFEVVGRAADGDAAVADLRRLRPDVAVLDVAMPGLDGPAVLRRIATDAVPTRVLFLSAHADSETVYAAVAAGARGYLLKDAGPAEICDAIARVARGGTAFAPDAQSGLIEGVVVREREPRPALSDREREVLALIAAGASAPQVAERLHLSVATVKTHLQHLYEKLGVSDRAAAAAEGLRRGLIE